MHSEIAPFAAVSSAVVLALCTWAAFTCLKDGRDQTSVMVLSAGAGAAVIILAGAVLALFDRYPAFTAGSALIALAGCATGPEPCDPYRPSSSATLTRASAEVPSDALREASTRLIEPKGN